MPRREPREILYLYNSRRKERGSWIAIMEEIKRYYNADPDDLIVPLPEMDTIERPAVANLTMQGIDQSAARIASVLPMMDFPSLKPGQKRADDYARIRQRAMYGLWETNDMDILLNKRARFFQAYAYSPVIIKPDFKLKIPVWKIQDPLTSFPSEVSEKVKINDIISVTTMRLGDLRRDYPAQAASLSIDDPENDDARYEILEYIDEHEISMFVIGKKQYVKSGKGYSYEGRTGMNRIRGATSGEGSMIEPLYRIDNRAGVCTGVVATRLGLDRPKSPFESDPDLFMNQALLTALEIIGIRRGIFADTWAIQRQGEVIEVVATPDGKTGKMGILKGGDVKEMVSQPGYMTNPMIDRIERTRRLNAGVPAEYGGESPTNIRTDRRGQTVMSSAVDFPIAEAQKVLEKSLQQENIRAIAVDKAYFGNTKKSLWVSWKGAKGGKGEASYTPNIHFETDQHTVQYSAPGSDINALTINVGQAIGMELMSKKRGRELNPLIEDPEQEHDFIQFEALEAATLAGLQQQAAQGAIPPRDIARIAQRLKMDKADIFQAMIDQDEEAQRRQAEITAEGTPDTVPEGSPEAQPGLAQPGMGNEAASAPAGNGQPSPEDLSKILFSLRSAQRQSPSERAPVG